MFPRGNGTFRRWAAEKGLEGVTTQDKEKEGMSVIGAAFWEGDATKHFLVKKRVFSEKGGGIQ